MPAKTTSGRATKKSSARASPTIFVATRIATTAVNTTSEKIENRRSPIFCSSKRHNVRDHRAGTSDHPLQNTCKSGFACITLLSHEIYSLSNSAICFAIDLPKRHVTLCGNKRTDQNREYGFCEIVKEDNICNE